MVISNADTDSPEDYSSPPEEPMKRAARMKDSPLERAAMRWWKEFCNYHYPRGWGRDFEARLAKACARHARKVKP